MKPVWKRFLVSAALCSVPLTLYGLVVSELQVSYSVVIGTTTGMSQLSFAAGYNNFISANNSAAIGHTLQIYQNNTLATGQYNSSSGADGNLFVIGRGASHTGRVNALTVNADGTVNIPGTATIGSVPVKGGLPAFTGAAPSWWSGAQFGFLKNPVGTGTDSSPANVG